MLTRIVCALGAALIAFPAICSEVVRTPRPVPATRPAMKALLEDMKGRSLRIPIPELTAEERENLGESADRYESRLRYHYLPGEQLQRERSSSRSTTQVARAPGTSNTSSASRGSRRNADENMTLSYPFKTMLFWIVSRTNNCQYCLGHQEQKLAAAGMTEEEVASLDSNWDRFTPSEQAAFAYSRKLTYEPYLLNDADIDQLKTHYTELQILEMTMSVAGNNATNRWKEGTGIPQSSNGIRFFATADGTAPQNPALPIESYLTPTPRQFQSVISIVAPLEIDTSGKPTGRGIQDRPALEDYATVLAHLEAVQSRKARLPLLDEAAARKALGESVPAGPLPLWLRLLANFPNDSQRRLKAMLIVDQPAEVAGDLTPLLKAQVQWIIARQDRAWYVTALAQERLLKLGQTPEQIAALDGDWKSFSSAERALFHFARQQAMTPIALTDADAAEALEMAGPRSVVQLIDFVTGCVYLNRVTEAAGLPTADKR